MISSRIGKLLVAVVAGTLLLVLGMAVQQVGAATYIVSNLNDSGAGSLRQAITDANLTTEADRIFFADNLTGTIHLASELPTITKPLSIIGPGPSVLEISGEGAFRVFSISPGPAYMTGVSISNGSSVSGTGGGINSNGDLTVTNSVFYNNSATGGGGICFQGGGKALIRDCTFTNNSAENYSGAVAFGNGDMTISGSTFSGNHADDGGAIGTVNPGTLTIRNSTFADNTGNNGGGALSAGTVNNTVYLTNNTFSGNHSPVGGALYIAAGVTVHAINNIFANSTGGSNCDVAITGTNSHNIDFGGAGTPNTCGPAVTGDPKLSALADNGGLTQTMSLGAGSAALDAGDQTSAPATDQRGWPRPAGTAVDIGAFESMTGYTLTLTKTGTGLGRLTTSPAGIDCGTGCTSQSNLFAQNQLVTLSLLPFDHSIFAGGSGAGCGYQTLLDQPRSCTAEFTLCSGDVVQEVLLPLNPNHLHPSIMDAYNNPHASLVQFQVMGTTLVEELNFSGTSALILAGGYNCTFVPVAGNFTYLIGSMTIGGSESVTVDSFVFL